MASKAWCCSWWLRTERSLHHYWASKLYSPLSSGRRYYWQKIVQTLHCLNSDFRLSWVPGSWFLKRDVYVGFIHPNLSAILFHHIKMRSLWETFTTLQNQWLSTTQVQLIRSHTALLLQPVLWRFIMLRINHYQIRKDCRGVVSVITGPIVHQTHNFFMWANALVNHRLVQLETSLTWKVSFLNLHSSSLGSPTCTCQDTFHWLTQNQIKATHTNLSWSQSSIRSYILLF